MSKSFNSWSALKATLQQEVRSAMEETVDNSFMDAHTNVDQYYNSTPGRYVRTGQLAESPEALLSGSGDSYHGEISLDTGFRYNPSGRDTMTIYEYAESGGLRGNGGFWEKTKQDVEKNIQESFGKRFS